MNLRLGALWTLGFAVMALWTLAVYAEVVGQWQVNVQKSGRNVSPPSTGATQDEAWDACLKRIATQPAGTATWTCQTPRYVAKVQADPLPVCTAPQPANETRPQPCPSGTTGSWTQTSPYVIAAYPTCWQPSGQWAPTSAPAGACTALPPPDQDGDGVPDSSDQCPRERGPTPSGCPPVTPPPPPPTGSTVVFYTDLVFAPIGAPVTVFGRGLDAPVTGATVISQSATKTVLRWTGGPATIGGVSVAVATRAGTVREATPSTLSSACSAAKAGDVILLHGGSYSQRCGPAYNGRLWNLGGAHQNVTFVGYPGEIATVRDVYLGDGSKLGDGVVLANLSMSGADCVFGASWWESEESGAKNVRVVNVDCRGTYGGGNTMTGLIALGGDGWAVLGNRFSNNAPSPINNNHGVYINVGADDVEVAWNRFSNMKMGHVIQAHTDGTLRKYERLSIHDNDLIGTNPQDMRGINISGCTADSSADIYNNVLLNLGQDFSGINVYCGAVKIRHNTLANIAAPPIFSRGGKVEASNNITLGRANSGPLNGANNITSGTVDANGRMTNPPKAPNVGITSDHDGKPRGATVSVGAYE